MALLVETKDATALSDGEIAEMADLSAHGPAGFDVGYLSKQRDEWVLVTKCYDGNKLRGWSFFTLERIGGTPCLIIGVASVESNSKSELILKHVLGDQYRRSVLAFPDEDVLVGTRMMDSKAFAAFQGLIDIVPRPTHKPTGEERAWGRRLAKRFGGEHRIDDRIFVLKGTGEIDGLLDFTGPKVEIEAEVAAQFDCLDIDRRDTLVTFGWATAEDLAAGKLGR
ncbi:MAG: hypothetical protein HKL80_10665 [Acidimicrobiales bacterium]|nr:hypothetical protein [Acidimicrobiales bacterium]